MDKHGEIAKRKISKNQKQLSDAEVASIIEEYKNGISTYDLAKKYGCHRETISNHLKKHGIIVSIKKITTETETEIIKLYENGLPTKEIAERFGVGKSTVKRYLYKKGIEMRTRWDY